MEEWQQQEVADWQQRVIDERSELRGRLARLRGFLQGPAYNQLDDLDGLLLCRQERLMSQLNDLLTERIVRFEKGFV